MTETRTDTERLVALLREPVGKTYGSWTPDEIRSLLTEAADALEAAGRERLISERAKAERRHLEMQEYSIALQRAIEAHCCGESVPDGVAALCPYHSAMLNAALATTEEREEVEHGE